MTLYFKTNKKTKNKKQSKLLDWKKENNKVYRMLNYLPTQVRIVMGHCFLWGIRRDWNYFLTVSWTDSETILILKGTRKLMERSQMFISEAIMIRSWLHYITLAVITCGNIILLEWPGSELWVNETCRSIEQISSLASRTAK